MWVGGFHGWPCHETGSRRHATGKARRRAGTLPARWVDRLIHGDEGGEAGELGEEEVEEGLQASLGEVFEPLVVGHETRLRIDCGLINDTPDRAPVRERKPPGARDTPGGNVVYGLRFTGWLPARPR